MIVNLLIHYLASAGFAVATPAVMQMLSLRDISVCDTLASAGFAIAAPAVMQLSSLRDIRGKASSLCDGTKNAAGVKCA